MDSGALARRFLAIRLAFWIGAAVTLIWSPIRVASNIPPFHAWFGLGDRFFDTFAQWDSGWFLSIAEHGYTSKQVTAFFPLYPLVVHGVAEVVRSYVVAGVLVSLAAGAIAVIVLHRLARPLLGEAGANDTVLFVVLYPLAFVFTAAYSDGLFLALAAGSFLAATQRRPLLAGVLGGLACGTRLIGLALLPADRFAVAAATTGRASARPARVTSGCGWCLRALPRPPLRGPVGVRARAEHLLEPARACGGTAERPLARGEVRLSGSF